MIDFNYGQDGTRAVILREGDVLLLAGPTETDGLAAALATVREALGLRLVVCCDRLDAVQVRDLDAELADAVQSRDGLSKVLEQANRLNEQILDERGRLLGEVEALREEVAHLKFDAGVEVD